MRPPLCILVVALAGCGSTVDVDGETAASADGAGAAGPTSGAGAAGASGGTVSTGPGGGSSSGAPSSGANATSGPGATSGGPGMTTSGGGPGATAVGSGSSGSGPPPSDVCGQCAEQAIENVCAAAHDACLASFACSQLLECHQDCEWTTECNVACDEIIPSGVDLLHQLIGCVACDACPGACSGSSLEMYCY